MGKETSMSEIVTHGHAYLPLSTTVVCAGGRFVTTVRVSGRVVFERTRTGRGDACETAKAAHKRWSEILEPVFEAGIACSASN